MFWGILSASWWTAMVPSPLDFDSISRPIVSLLSFLWKVISGPCFQQASFFAHSFAGMDSCVQKPPTNQGSLLPSPWSVVKHRLHRHNSENLASCVAYEIYRTNIQALSRLGQYLLVIYLVGNAGSYTKLSSSWGYPMETNLSTVRSNPRDSYSGDLYTVPRWDFS